MPLRGPRLHVALLCVCDASGVRARPTASAPWGKPRFSAQTPQGHFNAERLQASVWPGLRATGPQGPPRPREALPAQTPPGTFPMGRARAPIER